MDNKSKRKYWKWSCLAVIFLSVISFTPLIIPNGTYKPMVFGVPYSLWTSFLITVLLVVLTYIGTKVHPGMKDEEVSS